MPLNNNDLKSIGELIDTRVKSIVESNNGKLIKQVGGIVDDSIEKNNASIRKVIDDSIEKNNENIKDMIDFAIEKSEIRMTEKIEKGIEDSATGLRHEISEFREEMNREITDISNMNRAFIARIDNHEHRIGKLEIKTGLAVK